MAKRNAHDLREMTLTELESLVRERSEELMQMRMPDRLQYAMHDGPSALKVR